MVGRIIGVLSICGMLHACSPDSDRCVEMRTAAVYRLSLASIGSQADPTGEDHSGIESVVKEIGGYREAVSDLRRVLRVCKVPDDESRVTHEEAISGAEILLLAELDEELEVRLRRARSLSAEQQGSLLSAAAAYRDLQTLKKVIAAGVSPDTPDIVGYNAINSAVGSSVESVRKICYLWRAGVDPFHRVNDFSAMHGAILEHAADDLRVLLAIAVEESRDIDAQIDFAIDIAEKVEFSDIEVLRAFPNLDNTVEGYCDTQLLQI